MSANHLGAADEGSFCAKRGKSRSGKRFRQAAQCYFRNSLSMGCPEFALVGVIQPATPVNPMHSRSSSGFVAESPS